MLNRHTCSCDNVTFHIFYRIIGTSLSDRWYETVWLFSVLSVAQDSNLQVKVRSQVLLVKNLIANLK